MRKIIFLVYFLLQITYIALGQSTSNGSVSGYVLNETDKSPIEYATVALFNAQDSVLIKGTITDAKGKFSISEISFGKYYLVTEFIGFNRFISNSFILNSEKSKFSLGQLYLKTNSELIEEIEVVVEKPLVMNTIDKKVFNAEQNITSAGGTALDVLQNVPSVSVDQDGNVSMRGNSNVTILIDGKQSNLTGGGRQALLEQIPASNIADIELITNPSAKYDPDGLSGIINIVLKKNKLQGFNGFTSLTLGNNWKHNFNGQLSYKNNKWNVFSNYSYNINNRNSLSNSYRNSSFGENTTILEQDQFGFRNRQTHMLKAGADYSFNKNNTLSFASTVNINNNNEEKNIEFRDSIPNSLLFLRNRNALENGFGNSYELNSSYSRKFKKQGKSLDISMNYSSRNGEKQNDNIEEVLDVLFDDYLFPKLQNVLETNKNEIFTSQIDYVVPINDKIKLETGLKNINRTIENSFFSESNLKNTDSLQYEVQPDSLLNNIFNFNESISAAYLMSSCKFNKKWSAQAGLRAEQTTTTSTLINTNERFNNNYFSLFPSAYLNYVLVDSAKESANITLSYSRRINRPSVRALNPFTDYSNPQSLRRGNPFLNPEYIDSYDLAYSKFKNGVSFNASAYFKYTHNLIDRVISYNEDRTVSFTQQENLGYGRIYGLDFSVGGMLTKWWRLMLSGNGFLNQTRGILTREEEYNLNNDALGFRGNLISNFKVKNKYDIQLTSWYRAPIYFAQGKIKSMKSVDIAVKRAVLKNKGEVSLRLTDIFDTQEFGIDLDINGVIDTKLYDWESRNIFIGFSYRFGKMNSNNGRRERKSNHNEGNFDGGSDQGM